MSAMAAVGSATAAEVASAAAEAVGGTGTANKSTIVARPSVISAAIVAATPVVAAAIISPGATVVAAPIIAVEPRTGADEDAAHKPVGAVVAVRGAVVRVIIIVTVGANGSRTVVDGATNADSDTHLGVRATAKNKKQQSEQSHVLEISHLVYLCRQHRSCQWAG